MWFDRLIPAIAGLAAAAAKPSAAAAAQNRRLMVFIVMVRSCKGMEPDGDFMWGPAADDGAAAVRIGCLASPNTGIHKPELPELGRSEKELGGRLDGLCLCCLQALQFR